MLRVLIPQAFENMEEATIGKWLRNEGDAVSEGDALCELITEKTTFDLPAENVPSDGVLRRIVAPEKSVVPVGYCIALIGAQNENAPDVESENAALLSWGQEKGGSRQETARVETRVMSTPSAGTRLRATPAARRAAKDRGVALEEIAVAIPNKVLTEEDVAKYLSDKG
jgi:pyruvate/2-oxoglutarate dehydrogenase complex dihydrolipoamide acyltransferase (E2) component